MYRRSLVSANHKMSSWGSSKINVSCHSTFVNITVISCKDRVLVVQSLQLPQFRSPIIWGSGVGSCALEAAADKLVTRTAMKTPRRCFVQKKAGETYIHLRLKAGLMWQLREIHTGVIHIDIQMKVDGIRANNCSYTQLWPILFRIISPFIGQSFVIGIYCGKNKPTDVQQFVSDTVTDLTDVLVNGVSGVYHIHTVRPSCIVCDSNARAFLKQMYQSTALDVGVISVSDAPAVPGDAPMICGTYVLFPYGHRNPTSSSTHIQHFQPLVIQNHVARSRFSDATTEKFPGTNIRPIKGVIHRWLENERQKVGKRHQE
ncbi:hypothetical protein CLF_105278 [Clonorchis sinensis]|uniref:Uncharacterized protein n=1 Tax=Clonorchis sinensis TaxID=79923 RepID=G7YP65_CLOSI|nr:hypothetical protein CLF_105278 [Clonorchis sinensis]